MTQSIQDLQRLVPAGLSAAFNIMALWGLDIEEQMALLGVSKRRTLDRWRKCPPARMGRDHLERISHVLAIYRYLHTLLPDSSAADQWVKRPNTELQFGGSSALDLMMKTGNPGLFVVRQYLAAEVGIITSLGLQAFVWAG